MMATTRTLKIVNKSSYEPPDGAATIRAIAQAITIQLRQVATMWGAAVWQVVNDAHKRGFRIVLQDNAGTAGDDGYHDLDCAVGPTRWCFSIRSSITTAAGCAAPTRCPRPCHTKRASS